jgi:hypothetical protein
LTVTFIKCESVTRIFTRRLLTDSIYNYQQKKKEKKITKNITKTRKYCIAFNITDYDNHFAENIISLTYFIHLENISCKENLLPD